MSASSFSPMRAAALAVAIAATAMTTVTAAADVECGWSPFRKWHPASVAEMHKNAAEFRAYAACKDRDADSVVDPFAKSLRRDEAEKARREAKEIEEAFERAKKPGASIGMTAEQVIAQTNWGRPEHVNRTTTAGGTREQWVYPGYQYLYFQEGKLISIQTQQAQ
jgi:hypothetical protein